MPVIFTYEDDKNLISLFLKFSFSKITIFFYKIFNGFALGHKTLTESLINLCRDIVHAKGFWKIIIDKPLVYIFSEKFRKSFIE